VPLRKLFEEHPEVTVDLDRVIPLQNRVIPYFWVSNANSLDFENGFDPGQGIERLHVVDELDGRVLVRIEWREGHNGLAQALEQSQVAVISAIGTVDGWRIEVRGDDRHTISQFHELCSELGVSLRLKSLHRLVSKEHADTVELTEPQREALLLAYEQGYYDSPRTTTLADLADYFDISRQAVSTRLKRGTRQLIENTLV
jgi:predicted DNA binding protein